MSFNFVYNIHNFDLTDFKGLHIYFYYKEILGGNRAHCNNIYRCYHELLLLIILKLGFQLSLKFNDSVDNITRYSLR